MATRIYTLTGDGNADSDGFTYVDTEPADLDFGYVESINAEITVSITGSQDDSVTISPGFRADEGGVLDTFGPGVTNSADGPDETTDSVEATIDEYVYPEGDYLVAVEVSESGTLNEESYTYEVDMFVEFRGV